MKIFRWLFGKKEPTSAKEVKSTHKLDNLAILPNGDFQLNPESGFPLTLYNTHIETIYFIQNLFIEKPNNYGIGERIRFLFMAQPIGIREVDNYMREKNTCLLDARVDMNPISSFYYKDKSKLYGLCNKYSPEVMDFYFQELRYRDYVRILDNQDKLMVPYKKLIQIGMAIQGEGIPLHLIMVSLGREKLCEIGRSFNIKPKKKNIDTAILFCENKDIVSHLKTIINLKNCFMIKGLSEVEDARGTYDYAHAIAELFYRIYASYFYRYCGIIRAEAALKHGAIEGLQYNKNDCLQPECQERHGKVYSIKEARDIKFKLSCKCDLLPYNSKW